MFVQEYERRFRLDALPAVVRHRFAGTGGRRVVDVTFGPSGPESMARDGYVVRIRSELSSTRLEYKAIAGRSQWRELGIDVLGTVVECAMFLSAIGLRPGLLIDRERAASVTGEVTICVDHVRWLGSFIEFEGTQTAVENLLSELGILGAEADQPPYGDLLATALANNEAARTEHAAALAVVTGLNAG